MASVLIVAGVAERHVPTSVAVQDRAWVAPADPAASEGQAEECPAASEGQAGECPAASEGQAAVDCRASAATAFVRLNQRRVPPNLRRVRAQVRFRRSAERRDHKCPTYRTQVFHVPPQAAYSGRRPTFRVPEIPIWVRVRRCRFPDRSGQRRDHHFPTPAPIAQVVQTSQSGRKHCRAVRRQTLLVQTSQSGRKHCPAARRQTLHAQVFLNARKHCRAVHRQTSHAQVFRSDRRHCRAVHRQTSHAQVFPSDPQLEIALRFQTGRIGPETSIVLAETIGIVQVIPTAPSLVIDPIVRTSVAEIWLLVVAIQTSISTTTLTIGSATRTGVGTADGITVGTADGITGGTVAGITDGIAHLGTTAIGICIGGQAGIDQCQTIMSAGGLDLGRPIRRL